MSDTHKKMAAQMRQKRSSPFHTYPSSGTLRSQAKAMIRDLNEIIANTPEGVDVPPWVITSIGQSQHSVNKISNYITYYGK